ncbi:unnamed protein product [Lepidochelys olivacea]
MYGYCEIDSWICGYSIICVKRCGAKEYSSSISSKRIYTARRGQGETCPFTPKSEFILKRRIPLRRVSLEKRKQGTYNSYPLKLYIQMDCSSPKLLQSDFLYIFPYVFCWASLGVGRSYHLQVFKGTDNGT